MKHWLETRLVYDRLRELHAAGRRAALATVVRVRGSAYRHEGAKLLVAEDGSTTGNVSGGCLELDVREVALQVIASQRPQWRQYCSSTDEITAWDLGVGCEGQVDVIVEPVTAAREPERALLAQFKPFASVTVVAESATTLGKHLVLGGSKQSGTLGSVELDAAAAVRAAELRGTDASGLHELLGTTLFFDVFEPPPQLIIVSAGDDARPLARLASEVGFRVLVVDHRPGLLTAERFPSPTERIECDPAELRREFVPGEGAYAVVMTHNYADDQRYLQALLELGVSYIGMLGPRQRTERIIRELGVEGTADEGRIYGPVGLDIGTDGAEQVALAVMAEILAVRSGRLARSLRERHLPIHA